MKNVISFVCILLFSLFFHLSDSLAVEVGNDLNNNLSKDLNSNNFKNNKNPKTNISNEDLFGDEQAFPFIAGLGKNAAH